MKKLFLILFGSMIFSTSNACEICGCGVGNYYIGILPHFSHRFVGLRYHFNSFRTRLTDDPTQFSKDFFQTVEFWGGWNIGKKLQLLAFVPYNFNHQESDEGIVDRNGLGDVAILFNYKLLDIQSKNSNNKMVNQQFWIGAGIKLPTGKFEIEPADPDLASVANTQLGSGGADFLINAMYNVSVNNLGVNTSANYKINSVNKEGYKFGNKLSASSFIYCAIPASKTMISPNAGILFEHSKGSEIESTKIDLTGGTLLQAAVGMEISHNKISFGFNIQVPVAQNFAENQTKSKLKGMAHVSFAL